MSESEIKAIIKAIEDNGDRITSLEKAIKKLNDEDEAHWDAIDSTKNALTTGQHRISDMASLLKEHDKALSKAQRDGAAKAGLAMIIPTTLGIIEIIQFIATHWP